MLVTTKMKDAHVHICVQTGLGTGVPGPANSNIGTTTTVTHRAENQRLLECIIMEHSLTATNTFNNNDAKNTNIYTCNCNGCHEPQQIDYVLSSDHSLCSRTFDSSATSSDHWGLTTTIRNATGKHCGETRQETYRIRMQRPHRIKQHRPHAVEFGAVALLVRSCGSVIILPSHCTCTQMDRPGTRRDHRNALDVD